MNPQQVSAGPPRQRRNPGRQAGGHWTAWELAAWTLAACRWLPPLPCTARCWPVCASCPKAPPAQLVLGEVHTVRRWMLWTTLKALSQGVCWVEPQRASSTRLPTPEAGLSRWQKMRASAGGCCASSRSSGPCIVCSLDRLQYSGAQLAAALRLEPVAQPAALWPTPIIYHSLTQPNLIRHQCCSESRDPALCRLRVCAVQHRTQPVPAM